MGISECGNSMVSIYDGYLGLAFHEGKESKKKMNLMD
jgi:hypothetical protein